MRRAPSLLERQGLHRQSVTRLQQLVQRFPPALQPGWCRCGRLRYLSRPWSAVLSNECSHIQPKVLFPPFLPLMHRLQAQRQTKSPQKWTHEPTSSLRKVSLLLYFILAVDEKCAFCSTAPSAMIPWGILLIIFQSDSQLTTSFQNEKYWGGEG